MMKISLSTKNLLTNILEGICWIGLGVSKVKDTKPFIIFQIVFSVILISLMIINFFINCEDGDEMSELNMLKAKADSFESLYMIVFGTGVINLCLHFFGKSIGNTNNFMLWIYAVMGVVDLSTGIRFWKYERHGDN